jgi:hypothetical protein
MTPRSPSPQPSHYTNYATLVAFFFHGSTALAGLGLLLIEVSRSHSDTPHPVGLLWTSDRPIAKTSTWLHPALTRDRHPFPGLDSNPRSQQASGRRPTPETARPLGSAAASLTRFYLYRNHAQHKFHIPEVYSAKFIIPTILFSRS